MRNPEFQFLSTDQTAMETWLIKLWESISGSVVRPASPERLVIQWAASAMIQERARVNRAVNQNIPSRAEGENLDALAQLFYAKERTLAKAAVCTVRFHISMPQKTAVLIPAGTRVTDENQSLYWATEADAWIPAGAEYLDVEVRCQTRGKAGNGWAAGQINMLVDIYDYYSTCENTVESDGGADTMTDEELYQEMRLSMDALSTAGPFGSYIYHAKRVSTEIADVAVSSPSPCEVRIFALMKNGEIAGETMKKEILEACGDKEVRPLTDHVEMADPERVEYEIDLTYYLPSGGVSGGAEIEAAIQQRTQEYIRWQGGKMGRDINPSKLISMLMETGIKRVDVRKPFFVKLRDGRIPLAGGINPAEYAVPQVAVVRTGHIALINGGTEDE